MSYWQRHAGWIFALLILASVALGALMEPPVRMIVLRDFAPESWVCVEYDAGPPRREANRSCLRASIIREFILRNAEAAEP